MTGYDKVTPPRAWTGGFERTDETVKVIMLHEGKFQPIVRPVLRLGDRLFAGETLSMLNPYGYGGRVWSGRDVDELQHNIYSSREGANASDRSGEPFFPGEGG